MRSFPKSMAWVCLLAISLLMFGCGGGGSSSSDEMPMDDGAGMMPAGDGDGMMPTDDTAMDDDMDDGPTQAEIDAEAMKVAGALAGTTTDANANVSTGLPAGVTAMGSGAATGRGLTDTKADPDASYTAINGWRSNAYMKQNQAGNVITTGVLYNNEENPNPRRYATFFAQANTDTRPGFVADSDAALTGGTGLTGQLTFDFTSGIGTHTDKFDFSGFAEEPGNAFDLKNANDPDTEGADHERIGSFYGIDGKYICTTTGEGGTCSARVNSSGALVFTGTWAFRPDSYSEGEDASATNGNRATGTMVAGVVPDPEYMVFGYWVEVTTDSNGEETYKVNISNSGMGTVSTAGMEGTATYAGPATGLYMKKTIDSDGSPTSPFSSGQFTADAMLSASFGGGTVGTSHTFTVQGTISNFVDSNNDEIADWTLMLNRGDANSIDGSGVVTETGTSGCRTCDPGEWSGNFYGTNNGADNDSTTTADNRPAAMTGVFNGHFLNGHVAGAFGASLQPE